MRTILFHIGFLVATISFALSLISGFLSWLFRDGMGPGTVHSTGFGALSNFWQSFREPVGYFGPPMLLGLLWMCCCWWISNRKIKRKRTFETHKPD